MEKLLSRYTIWFSLTIFSLMTFFVSCGNMLRGNEQKAIREYAEKQLRGDSSEYVRYFIGSLDSLETDKQMRRGLLDVGRSMMLNGRHSEAIHLIEGFCEIEEQYPMEDEKVRKDLMRTYVCIGAAYDEIGMSGMALDYYTKGLELAKDSVYDSFRAMLYNNIGVLYSRGYNSKGAEEYFMKALEINTKLDNGEELFLNYSNLAELYHQDEEYEKAIDCSLKGIQYISAEKRPEEFYYTHLFLGLLYSHKGQYDIAMSYMRNGLSRLNELNSVPGTIQAYQRISNTYMLMGLPDSTEMYAKKSLKLSKEAQLYPLTKVSYELLAKSLKDQGKYKESVEYYEEMQAVSDSIENEENRLRLQGWGGLASESRKEEEKIKFEDFAVEFLLISLILGCILVWSLRSRRKIQVKEHEEHKKCEELVKTNEENTAELDRINREKIAEALENVKMREGLENACDELRSIIADLPARSEAQKMRHRALLDKLCGLSKDIHDEFKQYFEKVHPDFYKRLEEHSTELTTRDLRLCGFLVVGLSTKEIAALTFREVRSVESARNRLKKKLGLEQEQDLVEFLRGLR